MGEGPAMVRVRGKKTRYYAAIAAAAVLGAGVAVGTTWGATRRRTPRARSPCPRRARPAPGRSRRTPRRRSSTSWCSSTRTCRSTTTSGRTRSRPTPTGPSSTARRGTPTVNGLYSKITSNGPVGPLLTSNPNSFNPKRLTHSQALTCDQNHGYTAEQKAVDNGKMDQFVQNTETDTCTGQPVLFGEPGLVMDYYDGNTVTGLWNYAQNYAMSDNNWDTTFGPSTPGALNLISGQTGDGLRGRPEDRGQGRGPGQRQPAEQRRPGHGLRRPRPGLRRLLRTPATPPATRWPSRPARTSATCSTPGTSAGAGSRAASRRPGRTRPASRSAARRTPTSAATRPGLLAAPQPVRVLQVDRQPQAPAAVLRGRHRPHRPGQPPVRPVRLLHHAEGRQHAGGQLPEGGGVPGRPSGLF